MKLALIIHGVSCCILSIFFILSKKHVKTSDGSEPWLGYLNVTGKGATPPSRRLYAIEYFFIYLFVMVLAPFFVATLIYNLVETELSMGEEAKCLRKINKLFSKNRNNITPDYIKIAECLFSTIKDEKYDSIITCLPNLKISSEYKLVVELCKDNGYGDISKLAVLKACSNELARLDIWEYIEVENSPLGAWQAYLLSSIWHALPFFWHGGYNRRIYFFSEEEYTKFLISVKNSKKISFAFEQKMDIKPKIVQSGNEYYISCCYWSEWGGLIKEQVAVTINDNKIEKISAINEETLLKYDCGICF